MSNVPPDEAKDKVKGSRGAFPRLPLSDALKLAEAVFELGQGDKVRRLIVFLKLEKSADSGASRTLVISSNAYGLTAGGYSAEFLEITPRGKDIIEPQSESSKIKAVYGALFSNEMFSKFISSYSGKRVPEDVVAIDYFQHEHKLNADDAKACWLVFKSNISAYGLEQNVGGKSTIISREMATEKFDIKNISKTEVPPGQISENKQEIQVPVLAQVKSTTMGARITPEIHFNIQVIIPEDASAETYDAIFKSISTHLLGRNDE